MIDLDYQRLNINLKNCSTTVAFDIKMTETEMNEKLKNALDRQIAIGVNQYPGVPFFVVKISSNYSENGGFINYVLKGESE